MEEIRKRYDSKTALFMLSKLSDDVVEPSGNPLPFYEEILPERYKKVLYDDVLENIGKKGMYFDFESSRLAEDLSHRTQLIDILIYMYRFNFPDNLTNSRVKEIVKKKSIDLHKTLNLPTTKDLMEFIDGTFTIRNE